MQIPYDHDQMAADARDMRAALDEGRYAEAYAIFRPDWLEPLHKFPPALMPGIVRHVIAGGRVGDFLTAVLNNDLMDALGKADLGNRAGMFDITCFIHNHTPNLCHGSPAKVKAWQAEEGALGFFYDNADLEEGAA